MSKPEEITPQADERLDADRAADSSKPTNQVGTDVEKVDGRGLVTGEARYTDDIPTEQALCGRILFSPHAHARIVAIDTTEAEKIPGVKAILTHENTSKARHCRQGVPHPQPAPKDERIFDEKVRFVGDRVAAVAAETSDAATAALEAIDVEYDVLDHVLTQEEALAEGAPVVHDQDDYERPQPGADPSRNIVAAVENEEGDVEAAFEEADHVIEGEYETQTIHHGQMEMHTSIAWVDDRDRLVLRTSTQAPHLLRDMISRVLEVPRSSVRVVKPRVGGGFGGKQDMDPTQLITSALALETGEMVRLELTREEDLYTTHNRTAAQATVKAGVLDDGTLVGIHVDMTTNTGAFGNHGLTILSNGGHEPLSTYNLKNRRFTGRAMYTNIPPAAAMRGYGSPQGTFAVESHIDEVAKVIGMDPVELRRKNIVEDGQKAFDPAFSTSKRNFESIGLEECIDEATAAVDWENGPEQPEDGRYRRGYGIGLAMHKSGVPGQEYAGAEVTLEHDGTVTLRVGVGDIGQGAETAMAMIAAEVLGVETSQVAVRADDTDVTPWDNGAYGSSTTYISGNATEKAARDAAEKLREVATRWLDGDAAEFTLEDGKVRTPNGDSMPIGECVDLAFQGDNGPRTRITGEGTHFTHISPKPFAAQVAEVEVDTETGEFEVLSLITAADVGNAIHPENCRGQVIGGAIMGLGQAIAEELSFEEDGSMVQTGLRDYKSLRSSQIPERVEGILVEPYESTGPFGAKSVGEVTNNGPMAAVANAVADAVGARVRTLPITAERIRTELGN